MYGIPTVIEARNFIAKKYGFEYTYSEGCEISQKTVVSFTSLNANLDSTISAAYGKNWKLDFEIKATKLESDFTEVASLLKKHKPFIEKLKEFNAQEVSLYCKTLPMDTANTIFDVKLFYYLPGAVNPIYVTDTIYRIDLKNKIVM